MRTGGELGEVRETSQLESELLLHSRHPLQLCLVVLQRHTQLSLQTATIM